MRLYYYRISVFLNGDCLRDFFAYSDLSISPVKEKFFLVQKSNVYSLIFRCTKQDTRTRNLYSLDYVLDYVRGLI